MPLAVLTFLVTVAYLPGATSAATAGRWATLALGAAVLVWTVRVRWTVGHTLGGLLLAWMALGLWWSVSPLDTLGELWQWAAAGVIFLVAAETEDLTPCFTALALGVTASSAFAVLQLLGYNPVLSLNGGGHTVGLFLTRNMMVEVAVVALVGSIAARCWWGLPPVLLCLLTAGGREHWLLLSVALLTWAWIVTDRPTRWTMIAPTVAAAAAVLVVWSQHSVYGGYVVHVYDRLEIWSLALSKSTWLGWGLGTFGTLQPGYEYAHNELIHYTFELGLGVLLMSGVLGYALGAERTAERVALSTLVAASAVWFPMHAPATMFLGALLAGHLCGARSRDRLVQLECGAYGEDGSAEEWPLGIGAIDAADAGRLGLPAGPQHPLGSSHLRGYGA